MVDELGFDVSSSRSKAAEALDWLRTGLFAAACSAGGLGRAQLAAIGKLSAFVAAITNPVLSEEVGVKVCLLRGCRVRNACIGGVSCLPAPTRLCAQQHCSASLSADAPIHAYCRSSSLMRCNKQLVC